MRTQPLDMMPPMARSRAKTAVSVSGAAIKLWHRQNRKRGNPQSPERQQMEFWPIFCCLLFKETQTPVQSIYEVSFVAAYWQKMLRVAGFFFKLKTALDGSATNVLDFRFFLREYNDFQW